MAPRLCRRVWAHLRVCPAGGGRAPGAAPRRRQLVASAPPLCRRRCWRRSEGGRAGRPIPYHKHTSWGMGCSSRLRRRPRSQEAGRGGQRLRVLHEEGSFEHTVGAQWARRGWPWGILFLLLHVDCFGLFCCSLTSLPSYGCCLCSAYVLLVFIFFFCLSVCPEIGCGLVRRVFRWSSLYRTARIVFSTSSRGSPPQSLRTSKRACR